MSLTNPLAKAITTLEGKIVVACNFVLAIGALIPSHVIPPKTAVIVAGALNIALVIQRLVIKVQASRVQAQVLAALAAPGADFNIATVEKILEILAHGGDPSLVLHAVTVASVPVLDPVVPDPAAQNAQKAVATP